MVATTPAPRRSFSGTARANARIGSIMCAALIAVLAAVTLGEEQPGYVDELTIENPTAYVVQVQLGDGDSWIDLTTVEQGSTRVVGEGDGRLRVTGALLLRGVTREVTFPATVALEAGRLRGQATLSFLQSSFGYRPYSALLGAIRNKDEVTLHVDLAATP